MPPPADTDAVDGADGQNPPVFDHDVPGFPRCGTCRYARTGPAGQCAWCASRTIQAADIEGHCPVCCQALNEGESCRNWLCGDPSRRSFGSASAIAMKTGTLDTVLKSYKYDQRARGWRLIFARLLLGHLEAHLDPADVDLIVASPTWTGPPQYRYAHTEAVLDVAATEDWLGVWPFDADEPRAIVATGPRPRSAGASLAGKQESATRLSAVLHVPDAARVHGKRLLVYDDVFTSGSTLNVIARALRAAGAREVNGIILARQPWGWS